MARPKRSINDSFESLIQHAKDSAELMQCINNISAQLEQMTRCLGNPIHVVFTPGTQAELINMSPDQQEQALDAVGACINSPRNTVASIMDTLAKLLPGTLDNPESEDGPEDGA